MRTRQCRVLGCLTGDSGAPGWGVAWRSPLSKATAVRRAHRCPQTQDSSAAQPVCEHPTGMPHSLPGYFHVTLDKSSPQRVSEHTKVRNPSFLGCSVTAQQETPLQGYGGRRGHTSQFRSTTRGQFPVVCTGPWDTVGFTLQSLSSRCPLVSAHTFQTHHVCSLDT